MSWIRFVYADRLKTHVLPSQLVEIHDEYVADGFVLHPELQAAGLGPNPGIVTKCYLDLGGPAYAHRPFEVFFIDGLELNVASEELRLFAETWLTLPKRYSRTTTTATGYYKLHGSHCALVLTPHLFMALLANIQERLPAAEQRAAEFNKVHVSISTAIADANNRGPVS